MLLVTPRRTIVLLLVAVGALGAGGGAATYAALSTKTVVRQVTVTSASAAASTTGRTAAEIYRSAHTGVVEVTARTTQPTPFGTRQNAAAQGSGFVYDTDGHVVTNEHVVDGADSVSVKFWNGKTYTAHVVATDASTDLAVLKVDAPAALLHPLPLADSSKVAVGDPVVAIGSPFGLEESVTTGIVSGLHRQMTSPNNFTIDDSIQTDAAINHGNSGGPLLDANGRVIGVNTQIESDSGGSDGVGFAIPSNTVKSVVGQLLTSGRAEHAYLGVALNGRTVSHVRSGSPASHADLRVGDVIVAIDGHAVASGDELRSAINARKPGDTVSLRVTRGGTRHVVRVTLGNRPASA